MPTRSRAVPDNAPGDVFVDDTCIDCGLCRELAPAIFAAGAGHSRVHAQPGGEDGWRWARRAALACPTGSIGAPGSATAMDDFPLWMDPAQTVGFCGFASPRSFGGRAWFVRRADGNWLIDAPRWVPALAERLRALGGIARIFLTHQDDVADAPRYAAAFGAGMLIHARDRHAAPTARAIAGDDEVELAPGCRAIPTPGHTAGSWCLLIDDRWLFTGDHLWGDGDRLDASRAYCWHDWAQQVRSLERLRAHRFAAVLPGHGEPCMGTPDSLQQRLADLVALCR